MVYLLEMVQQEEPEHGFHEEEVFEAVKRFLLENRSNKDIDDWIQVRHDEVAFLSLTRRTLECKNEKVGSN